VPSGPIPVTDRTKLREYYEYEANQRLRQPSTGGRVGFRTRYIEQLVDEQRRSVLDFGAGAGHDGEAFVAAGFRFVGVDLAYGNCRLAAERKVDLVHGSIDSVPVRPASFDSGWSMSTLMHIADAEVPTTLHSMIESLRPDAPMAIGLWGGQAGSQVDSRLDGFERPFYLRPVEVNRSLIEPCGSIEFTEVWDVGPDDWEYQVFVLRLPE